MSDPKDIRRLRELANALASSDEFSNMHRSLAIMLRACISSETALPTFLEVDRSQEMGVDPTPSSISAL